MNSVTYPTVLQVGSYVCEVQPDGVLFTSQPPLPETPKPVTDELGRPASPSTMFEAMFRHRGVRVYQGKATNPVVLGWLTLHTGAMEGTPSWVTDDETASCSACVGAMAWSLGLEGIVDIPKDVKRSFSWSRGKPVSLRNVPLLARAWMAAGEPVELKNADHNCVLVYSRGSGKQPGAGEFDAKGHVRVFGAHDAAGNCTFGIGFNESGGKMGMGWRSDKNLLAVRRLRPGITVLPAGLFRRAPPKKK